MSTRSTIALTAVITLLVCVSAFSIFLLTGVFNSLITEKQNVAIQQFVFAIEANARKTDNQTQFAVDNDTTVYCMVKDTQVDTTQLSTTTPQ